MSEDRAGEAAVAADRGDENPHGTREAQEAHGGSMAPGQVDDFGQPIADRPPAPDGP